MSIDRLHLCSRKFKSLQNLQQSIIFSLTRVSKTHLNRCFTYWVNVYLANILDCISKFFLQYPFNPHLHCCRWARTATTCSCFPFTVKDLARSWQKCICYTKSSKQTSSNTSTIYSQTQARWEWGGVKSKESCNLQSSLEGLNFKATEGNIFFHV